MTQQKDYSKYFDFSNAKVISEDQDGKKIKINGRIINLKSEPSYKEEKKRGKETIEVIYNMGIPEELHDFGKGKFYQLLTYGCPNLNY